MVIVYNFESYSIDVFKHLTVCAKLASCLAIQNLINHIFTRAKYVPIKKIP